MRRLHKFAVGILHLRVRHLVLDRINQLDVAERARRLLDLPGDAFIPFSADTSRPVYRGICPDLLFPFRR